MARTTKATKAIKGKSNKELNWREFREKSAASTFVFQGISVGKVPRMRLKDEIFTGKHATDIVKPPEDKPAVAKVTGRGKVAQQAKK